MKHYIYIAVLLTIGMATPRVSADPISKPSVIEIGVPVTTYTETAAIEAPQAIEIAPVEEISVVAPEPIPAAPVVATETINGCGDNQYSQYIYQHESGCRLNATNAGGCLGIGQACPGSKLTAACPDLSYACQNAFFTAYASRYGGWEGAYQFWLNNSWW